MKLRTTVANDDLAAVRSWFDTLARHCRAVDYEGARPIFAEDMIAFGTFTAFMTGRDLAEQKQWRNVWSTIRNFRYDLDQVEAIVSADRLTAVGMAVWQSDGFHPNGDPFDRPGRTTVVLARKATADPFVAVHTHMSLFRGTPDQSFGKFDGP